MNHKIVLILASLMITPSLWSMGTTNSACKQQQIISNLRSRITPSFKAIVLSTTISSSTSNTPRRQSTSSTENTPQSPTSSPSTKSIQSNREKTRPNFMAPPSSPATQQDKEEAKQATEESSSNQQISVLERGQDLRLETLALVCFANRCERIKENARITTILLPLLGQEKQLVNTILAYNEEHKE